jgi:hypothetical protein
LLLAALTPHQTYVLESPVDENINPVVLIKLLAINIDLKNIEIELLNL